MQITDRHMGLAVLCFCALVGCSKDPALTPLASLNIFNGVAGEGPVLINFTNPSAKGTANYQYWSGSPSIGYGANLNTSLIAGKTTPFDVVATADTATIIYSTSYTFPADAMYSLFLAGLPGAVESILVREASFPYHPDSTCGVRFVNLSPNSQPVNISLYSNDSTQEILGLSYKNVAAFKSYSTKFPNASYQFYVFNAANDSLLTTYKLTTQYFHNVTLVLIGLEGSGNSPALSVATINN